MPSELFPGVGEAPRVCRHVVVEPLHNARVAAVDCENFIAALL